VLLWAASAGAEQGQVISPMPIDPLVSESVREGGARPLLRRLRFTREEQDIQYPLGAAFSPSGRFLAIVTIDGWLQVFDVLGGPVYGRYELDRQQQRIYADWQRGRRKADLARMFATSRCGITFVTETELIIGTWTGKTFRVGVGDKQLRVKEGPQLDGAVASMEAVPGKRLLAALTAAMDDLPDDKRARAKLQYLDVVNLRTIGVVELVDPEASKIDRGLEVRSWRAVGDAGRVLFVDSEGTIFEGRPGESKLARFAQLRGVQDYYTCPSVSKDGTTFVRLAASPKDFKPEDPRLVELFLPDQARTWQAKRCRIKCGHYTCVVYCGAEARRIFLLDETGSIEVLLDQGVKTWSMSGVPDTIHWVVSPDERRVASIGKDIVIVELPFP
jgi:hypothetical protein